jgi:acetyl esterase/lipase
LRYLVLPERPAGTEGLSEDALAALKLVRSRAKEWGIDPSRIGMMGFSAGAMTTLNAGLAKDAADRPAFIAPIYGPMLPLDVPADAPPMFSAFALDDELFSGQGFGLIERWHAAGRPVELHAYERGGHGFGLGRPGTSSSLMLEEFITWLQSRGTVPSSRP